MQLHRRVLVSIVLFAAAGFAQDTISASGYGQPYRPQFHFSPRKNWTNDPNGLVYFDGEYHLFYQFNPFGDLWGHMSWGHAVSRDLTHWQELPVALPEENGIMIFTGSTVVDEHNTSGFCTNGKPCMVAVYTGHTPESKTRPALQTQNIAYSNDHGRTWTKYSGNPVLNRNATDFRDPHVFWSEQARKWVMAVALPNDHKILFYGSGDLKHWELLSEFGPAGSAGGQWECPTMVELPVAGNPSQTRFVLKVGLNPGGLQGGSGEQYFVGSFDGTRFVNDNPASTTLWTDYGKDCYCALAFNAIPRGEPAVMMGWMNDWQYAGDVPTKPWRGQMTIPRTLSLRKYPGGLRLMQEPVKQIEQLRGDRFEWRGTNAAELNRRLKAGQTYELHATVDSVGSAKVTWKLLAGGGAFTEVGYDGARGELYVDRTHSGATAFSRDFPARTAAPLVLGNEHLVLTVLVDRSSIEVFAQDGLVAMTNLVFPPAGARGIELHVSDDRRRQMSIDLWTLKSIWSN